MRHLLSFRPGLRALALILVCVLGAGAGVGASIPPQPSPPAPERYFSKEALARGKVLVASGKMKDGHFARTVVLLTDYGWHGAVGVIINRPTDIAASRLLPYIKGLDRAGVNAWFGGPVDTGQVTMLIRSKKAPAASMRVLSDLYASTSIETLTALLEAGGADRFRLYAGYAGWAPQQLELEVAEGWWHVMDASSDEVFSGDAGSVWPRLIERAGRADIKRLP